MKLVTFATHSERYFPYLKLSAERNGHELVVLGWGEKWKGFTWRFELIRSYLKSVNEDEIICFIDAYDVLILRGPADIEHEFKQIIGENKAAILISEDRSSKKGVMYDITNRIFFHKCDNKYINAGTYMGYAGTILKLMDSMCSEMNCAPDENDQVLLQRYCANHKNDFIIDTTSNVFLVICNFISKIIPEKENFIIESEKLKYNGVYPCILHGTANADMDNIIKDLGYDPTLYSANNDDKWNYFVKNFKHFLVELFKKVWWILLILVGILGYFISNKYWTKRIPGRRRR